MNGHPAARGATGSDLRLLQPAVSGWAGAALGDVAAPKVSFGLGLVIALGGLVLLYRHRLRGRPVPLVLLAMLSLAVGGLVTAGLRQAAVGSGPLVDAARHGRTVQTAVVVTADPVVRPGIHGSPLVVLRARVERVTDEGRTWRLRQPVLVLTQASGWRHLLPSQRLTVQVRVRTARSTDVAAVLLARSSPKQVSAASWWQWAAARVRDGLRQAVSRLGPDERGLLPGVALGDTAQMPSDLATGFQTSGLTHLTAVSGANCAIVLGAVMLLLKVGGVGAQLRMATGLLVLLVFVVVVRPSPSVLRAALMCSLALLAMGLGRPRAATASLHFAVLVLVLVSPELAVQPGFALSVLATGGLLLLAPQWARMLAPERGGLRRLLAYAVAVPLAAEAVCGPVVAAMTGRISLVAVVANLAAAPAVAPATVLGVLAAVVSLVSVPVAAAVASVAGWPCWWLAHVARVGMSLPGASLPWPAGAVGLVTLLVTVVVLVAMVRRRVGRALVLAGVVAWFAVAIFFGGTRS